MRPLRLAGKSRAAKLVAMGAAIQAAHLSRRAATRNALRLSCNALSPAL